MDERFQAIATRLTAIYRNYAPARVESDGRFDHWGTFACALLARAQYTLESSITLRERPLDAAVLCRVLYEHVTTFAWLAADPAKHLPMLLKRELNDRKKWEDDARSLGLLEPEYAGLDAFASRYGRAEIVAAPAMPERARAASAHWSNLFETDKWTKLSFRAQYPTFFRAFSRYAHVTVSGLTPFVLGDGSNARIGPPEYDTPVVDTAPLLFGLALFVAERALGWPPRAEVLAAFEQGAPTHG